MLALKSEEKWLEELFTKNLLSNLIVILLYILIGATLLKIVLKLLEKALGNRVSPQPKMLIVKSVRFVGLFVIIALVLNRLEVPLSAILGTAGVATLALGIAAQTSISNIIGGIFLLSEHSFHVGDIIEVGAFIGTVESVDLLSVKLKTFDGLHVRLSNEKLIQSEITTITKNPTRRVALNLRIPYSADIPAVRTLLMEIAARQPLALKEPAPFFMVNGFEENHISLFFALWAETNNWANLKTETLIAIKAGFEKAAIEIPYRYIRIESGE
ncbi:MAG: mechanosensitive ion channel family protein [Sphaerochaetaceae bacterium]